MFLLRANGNVGELLELPQECQGNFLSSGGKVGFLLRCLSRIGPQLALRGESPGFPPVAAGFLSSAVGMSRNFLSCVKGVKDTFGAQEGNSDFSRKASEEKGLSLH